MMEKILPMNLWWKWIWYKPLVIGFEGPAVATVNRKIEMVRGLEYYLKKEMEK